MRDVQQVRSHSGTRTGNRYDEPMVLLDVSDKAPGTLLVAPTTAASFYDAAQIAYSRAHGSRAYYQLNRWTEQPSRRIHARSSIRHSHTARMIVRKPTVLAIRRWPCS